MSRNHRSHRISTICCCFLLAANSGGWFRTPRKPFTASLLWTSGLTQLQTVPVESYTVLLCQEFIAQSWCYSFRSYQLTRWLPLRSVAPAETVMIAHLHVFSNTRFRDGRWSNAATRIISTTNFLSTLLTPYSYYCYTFIVYYLCYGDGLTSCWRIPAPILLGEILHQRVYTSITDHASRLTATNMRTCLFQGWNRGFLVAPFSFRRPHQAP